MKKNKKPAEPEITPGEGEVVRKITIELLDEGVTVHCDGLNSIMEFLGLLKLAEAQLLDYQKERTSTLEMIEH